MTRARPATLYDLESEDGFKDWVIGQARVDGWRIAHFRPAQTAHGYRTPVQADGKGFPDLVLVRPPLVIFAELKSESGRLEPDQKLWRDALQGCSGVEWFVWKPHDRDEICGILHRNAGWHPAMGTTP